MDPNPNPTRGLQGDHPSKDVYTLKQVLQEHNTTYEILLCRSQLTQARGQARAPCSMSAAACVTIRSA